MQYYIPNMIIHPDHAFVSLQWRHNEWVGVSNHRRHDCLLNRLFGCRSKKTSKLRVTGLCEGNSPVTDEFPTQRARNAENASIWWRHRDMNSSNMMQSQHKKAQQISVHILWDILQPIEFYWRISWPFVKLINKSFHLSLEIRVTDQKDEIRLRQDDHDNKRSMYL